MFVCMSTTFLLDFVFIPTTADRQDMYIRPRENCAFTGHPGNASRGIDHCTIDGPPEHTFLERI